MSGQSTYKNPRKVFSQVGGGTDAALTARVNYLENNTRKVTYYAEINSASGAITKPTGSTIITDQFASGADAYVVTIVNGRPSTLFPQTAGGVSVDVATFDTAGNYILTGTPSAFPCALIYILTIKDVNWQNIIPDNILDLEDINSAAASGYTASRLIKSDTNGKLGVGSSLYASDTAIGVGVSPDSELTVSKQTTIVAPPTGTLLHLIGLDANSLRLALDTHNNAGAGGTAFLGRRSRGTAGSPSATQANDTIISMNGVGYGATSFGSASTGLIVIKANQAFTDTDQGTYVSIMTTPDGSVTAAESLRIKGNGIMNLPLSTASRIAIFDSNKDLIPADTATYPSLSEISYSKGVTSAIQNQLDTKLQKSGSLVFSHSALNPADATSYFIGTVSTFAPVTSTNLSRRGAIAFTGFIYSLSTYTAVAGTLGSSETATIKVTNKTSATTTTCNTNITYTTLGQTFGFELPSPLAVTIGDSIEIEIDMPTFGTNPTTVTHIITVNYGFK